MKRWGGRTLKDCRISRELNTCKNVGNRATWFYNFVLNLENISYYFAFHNVLVCQTRES